MFIIVTGDAFDGLRLWGPWEYMEDAHDWAERHWDHWDCVKIEDVYGDWNQLSKKGFTVNQNICCYNPVRSFDICQNCLKEWKDA